MILRPSFNFVMPLDPCNYGRLAKISSKREINLPRIFNIRKTVSETIKIQ